MNNYWKLGSIAAAALFAAGCSSESEADGSSPDTITVDYAYYSPTSLVLKEKGFLEEAFADEGTEIDYVLSQGSNNALEFLSGGSVDFGSSAGAAALMAKGNNAPIKNVYIYSQPEWTALVTAEDSDIDSVEDLAGKQVAATLGTDPYIFLIRALDEAGLSEEDIEVVPVQHNDGANLLANGEVDAWAGLDPHMARQELEINADLFHRNKDFNTYGFLNVTEDFAEAHPEAVETVIEAYEEARQWTLDNPEETVEIMVQEAGIDPAVAELQLERNTFDNPVPGQEHIDSLTAAGEVLQKSGNLDDELEVSDLLDELIDPSFAENVIND
ncbi:aliphatic sulfonate ABC transporter substrate-binding protein [Alkalicoccus luteus]|uniref:aliphatic sulfonate ABC transporter substrate-binding protein n=1 Tax=Alkalicoccus luteus TaxID=1237094 RepID=UPI00403389DB